LATCPYIDFILGRRLRLRGRFPFDNLARDPKCTPLVARWTPPAAGRQRFVKELAEREHCKVADLNAPVVAALEKAKATNPELAAKIIELASTGERDAGRLFAQALEELDV